MTKDKNTSEIQYFEQLDGFRFLSILAVMLSHFATSDFVDRFPFGYGVMFFFVLSSFLITRILLTAKEYNQANGVGNLFSLRQFYFRRFLRIFPIYYLLLIFMYAINFVPCREFIVSLLTYTTNLKIANGSDLGDFNHLWSLAVEEQFYIFFPFVIFFINSAHLLKFLGILVLVGVCGRAALYIHNSHYIPYSNFHTISCLDSLGIGAILAYLSIYKIPDLKKILKNKYLRVFCSLFFIAVMLASFTLLNGNNKYNFISIVIMRFSFNVLSFWILGWAVTFGYTGIMKSILENKFVSYLGRISYGMYLYHLFVPHLVSILLHHFKVRDFISADGFPVLGKMAIYSAVTIVIATISWNVIEKPANNLKRYFNYNKKLTPGVVSI